MPARWPRRWAWHQRRPGGRRVHGEQKKFAAALVKDLQANRGAVLVVVGDAQTPATHALAHAINASLGAVGKTVSYTEPVDPFAATAKWSNFAS